MPHEGFRSLLELSKSKKYQSFIFTSNVDGQFQKTGFSESQVMECHGSIHHLQCIDDCEGELWPADKTIIEIGEGFRAKDPLPSCAYCGKIARPNILMFGDFGWNYSRTNEQRDRLVRWMDRVESEGANLAIVEMGAGTSIPTVRNTSEQIARRFGVPLIRINPRESEGAEIGIALGTVDAISQIL